MIYPRIKPELDRRRKLTPDECERVKMLARTLTRTAIARAYGVSITTISYIVDVEYKERRKAEARKANARKRLDPNYIKRHRELSNLSHRYKRAVMPEEKEYDRIKMIGFKQRNPNYFKKIRSFKEH